MITPSWRFILTIPVNFVVFGLGTMYADDLNITDGRLTPRIVQRVNKLNTDFVSSVFSRAKNDIQRTYGSQSWKIIGFRKQHTKPKSGESSIGPG